MAWEPFLWVIFAVMNLALVAAVFYQYIAFSDLEADYLNPFELASRVNDVVVWEFFLHGAFSFLFLVTGHWFVFLLTLPVVYYNTKKYMERRHLVDVTEVFQSLNAAKKVRVIKLGFYVCFFALVIARLSISAISIVFENDDDIRGFG